MWFSPILILHISAGILGIVSGTAAISFLHHEDHMLYITDGPRPVVRRNR